MVASKHHIHTLQAAKCYLVSSNLILLYIGRH
jgi:hypothetical protein